MPGPLIPRRGTTTASPTEAAPSADALNDPLSASLLRDATPKGGLAPGQARSWKTPLPPSGGRPDEIAAAKAKSAPDTSRADLDLAEHAPAPVTSLAALDLAGHAPAPRAPIPTSAAFGRMASHIEDHPRFGYRGDVRAQVDPELLAQVSPGARLAPAAIDRAPNDTTDKIALNNARKQQKITTMMVPPSADHPAFIKNRDISMQPEQRMDGPEVHLSDDARKTFGAVPSNVALSSYLDMTTGQVQMAPLIPDSSGKSAALDHEDILHPDLVVTSKTGRTLNKPIRHTPPAARAGGGAPAPTGAIRATGKSSHEQVATRFEGDEGVANGSQNLLGFTTHKGGDGKIGALRWTSRTFNDSKFQRYETAEEESRRKALTSSASADPSVDAATRQLAQARAAQASLKNVIGSLKSTGGRPAKGKSRKNVAPPSRMGGLGVDGKLSESWRDTISKSLIKNLGQSEVFVSDEVSDPRDRHADDRPSAPSTAPLPGAAPLPQTAPLPAPSAAPLPTLRQPT